MILFITNYVGKAEKETGYVHLQQRAEIFKLENAETSLTSITFKVPDDPSPRDARQALKTLQCFAAKNLFGVAAMDALMKLEICMTDAKIDEICRAENALPE